MTGISARVMARVVDPLVRVFSQDSQHGFFVCYVCGHIVEGDLLRRYVACGVSVG